MAELLEGQASSTGHSWSSPLTGDRRFTTQRELDEAVQQVLDEKLRQERDRARREVERQRAAHAAEQEQFRQEAKDRIDQVLAAFSAEALERDLLAGVVAGDVDAVTTAACRLSAVEKVHEAADRALMAHLGAKP